VSPAKTAEPIEMLLGMWTWVGTRNHVSHGGTEFPHTKGANGAHCEVYGIWTLWCQLCKNGWTDWHVVWQAELGGPRNHVLDGGVHWGHVANTTEPSVCGSDVAYVKLLW